MNEEIKYLVKYIRIQKNYLKHLKATYKVTKEDIAQKEARLEELRREVKQNEQG